MVEVRRTLGGTALQFYGVALFDKIKIGAAVTAGFSFTTNSIGRERQSRGGMEWKRTRPFIFGTGNLPCFRQSPRVGVCLQLASPVRREWRIWAHTGRL